MSKLLYPEDWEEPVKDTLKRNENKVKQMVRDIASEIVVPIELHQIMRIICGYTSSRAKNLNLTPIEFKHNEAQAIDIVMNKIEGIVIGDDDCSSFTADEIKAIVLEVLPEFDDRTPIPVEVEPF